MSRIFVTLDLGGTTIKAALVDERGTILERQRRHTRSQDGPERVVADMEAIYNELSGKHGGKLALGICAPGPLDSRKGLVYTLPNLKGWENYPLGEVLHGKLKTKVAIENDANAAALGEWKYGAGKGVDDMILLTVGTGIGSGMICGGRLLIGADGVAGEAGHTTIDPDGPECGCGNRGCLEAMASATAATHEARRLLNRGRSSPHLRDKVKPGQLPCGQDILEGALHEDPLCLETLHYIARNLGIGIASLINIFNPRKILIGGGFSAGFDLMVPFIREAVEERAFKYQAKRCEIAPAALGNDAGMLGMLARLLEK